MWVAGRGPQNSGKEEGRGKGWKQKLGEERIGNHDDNRKIIILWKPKESISSVF